MITSPDWYRAILLNILTNGERYAPRGKEVVEVVNVSARIGLDENIVLSRHRKVNYRFMVAEFLWMAAGRNDVKSLARFNPNMAQFSDDGIHLDGAYGPWFLAGLPRVVDLLTNDPDSRQAFIKIGDPRQTPSKDVPCTMTWQFLVRDGHLHMVANMRSSDAWLGIPYDVYTFSQLANCVAGTLDVPRGWLYLNLASSHLYKEHVEQAIAVAHGPDDGYGRSPALPSLPPDWVVRALDEDLDDRNGYAMHSQTWSPYYYALKMRRSADALAVLTDDGRGGQP